MRASGFLGPPDQSSTVQTKRNCWQGGYLLIQTPRDCLRGSPKHNDCPKDLLKKDLMSRLKSAQEFVGSFHEGIGSAHSILFCMPTTEVLQLLIFVYLCEIGEPWRGLESKTLFYKDLLEKLAPPVSPENPRITGALRSTISTTRRIGLAFLDVFALPTMEKTTIVVAELISRALNLPNTDVGGSPLQCCVSSVGGCLYNAD